MTNKVDHNTKNSTGPSTENRMIKIEKPQANFTIFIVFVLFL